MTPPAIILSHPQLGENIGAAARAMANFGLSDLRLVAPRKDWQIKAKVMAVGAVNVSEAARVFATLPEALGDLQLVYATTARERGVTKPVLTPAEAARRLRAASAQGVRTGLLFGGERAGLDNDEVSLADAIITIPTSPDFSSLNLAQAVLLNCYEWLRAADETPPVRVDYGPLAQKASREDMFHLFAHLEDELVKSGFLFPPDKAESMMRNIRAMLNRADFTDMDVRTLRGMIVALSRGKFRRAAKGSPKEEAAKGSPKEPVKDA
ncbi:MAG TPA: RNA methyltransferase [Rhizomicrobium sp.]|nr:RNA methyltransferase [Rhizomicrobium sp.]